ncbi:hypothetical protein BC936DRAFT_146311 [Jimgerdemannia flammicorona]|uniref:Uncharacterized protein n=1 Tax=Jimgerdemannia flammicorona TaxID=994334 RepID=A0A433DLJ2_9FUNG|nr:hypothetical protein BC936DRAFT_146311 [Jimgerdemannia flammicorona]
MCADQTMPIVTIPRFLTKLTILTLIRYTSMLLDIPSHSALPQILLAEKVIPLICLLQLKRTGIGSLLLTQAYMFVSPALPPISKIEGVTELRFRMVDLRCDILQISASFKAARNLVKRVIDEALAYVIFCVKVDGNSGARIVIY